MNTLKSLNNCLIKFLTWLFAPNKIEIFIRLYIIAVIATVGWSVYSDNLNTQYKNVIYLKQKITEWQKKVDNLPANTTLKDKLAFEKDGLLLEKDSINMINAVYPTIPQLLGGSLLIIPIYIAWRTVKATEEKNITERYSKAVEQLGDKEKLEVRLGGIYDLERIAKDSKKDYWRTINVLIDFIRGKTSHIKHNSDSSIPPDVQAALKVIKQPHYLRGLRDGEIDLRGSYLKKAELKNAFLNKAYFIKVNFVEANLQKARLFKANLSEANLCKADMTDA